MKVKENYHEFTVQFDTADGCRDAFSYVANRIGDKKSELLFTVVTDTTTTSRYGVWCEE